MYIKDRGRSRKELTVVAFGNACGHGSIDDLDGILSVIDSSARDVCFFQVRSPENSLFGTKFPCQDKSFL